MLVVSYLAIAVLGLVMGSFAGATVWRIRARQLLQAKQDHEPVNAAELRKLTPLTQETLKSDRSRCLDCKHELSARDLVPVVSWLSTKGRCRYCNKPIGKFEPLMELLTMTSFVALFHSWLPGTLGVFDILLLVGGLVVVVMLVILFAYDAKWYILPDVVVFPLIAIGVVYAGYVILTADNQVGVLLSTIGSIAILGGLYLGLWLYSKGEWVGFGDVKLGLALGLLLADWRLAFLALFLANLIGTLMVLPGLLRRTMSRQTQVPFGPLLIAGFAIAALYGTQLIALYQDATMWLVAMTLMI